VVISFLDQGRIHGSAAIARAARQPAAADRDHRSTIGTQILGLG